jgi:hypothetical protein
VQVCLCSDRLGELSLALIAETVQLRLHLGCMKAAPVAYTAGNVVHWTDGYLRFVFSAHLDQYLPSPRPFGLIIIGSGRATTSRQRRGSEFL